MPECISEVLYKRDLYAVDVLDSFFKSPLKGISSPFLIKDMEKAAEILASYIDRKERICIYGDYDVDGVTSVALMFLFLEEIGADVSYYIPNRLEEGYGLNITAIDDIASSNTKLMITVDCGINAVKEVEYAKSKGIGVIITDHHQPLRRSPMLWLSLTLCVGTTPANLKGFQGSGWHLSLSWLSDISLTKSVNLKVRYLI